MYHEENVIDGVLCWRSTPNGEWIKYSDRQLTDKLMDISRQAESLYEKAPWWANPDIPAPKVTC